MITQLQDALDTLEAIPQTQGKYALKLDEQKNILLDLSYEINELKKDIFFLTHSENEFFEYLKNLHANFSEQTEKISEKLKNIKFKNLISDRDGTVNNYCGRYASSVQSVYNAVFLCRFAKNISVALIL